MATLSSFFLFFVIATVFSFFVVSYQQPESVPVLDSAEQDAVYAVLDSINPTIPWRTLFPDDLCSSAPHGVVCDYFTDADNRTNFSSSSSSSAAETDTVHVTELSFGYVSDYTPNPPCTPNSTLNPLLFTSFKYLRKLFFYKCFTENRVSVPVGISPIFRSSIEELVFLENPAWVGPLSGVVGNFTNLRRLVMTGNGVYGNTPAVLGGLESIEEITLSRNQLSGGLSVDFSKLKNLRVLDLSYNHFDGNAPDSLGNLTQLLKLDLSSNGFSGKIPETLSNLQSLEFLDLSYNQFGNFGVPVFLSKMPRLREVYLSGNRVGGQIPDMWENLGGILAIGFSNMGLVGNIPASMGMHLKNLCYLGLDNNKLEGSVPLEFGSLQFASEINLENNKLSGRVPFTAQFGARMKDKLKLGGNSELCVANESFEGPVGAHNSGSFGHLKKCNKTDIPNAALFQGGASPSSSTSRLLVLVSSRVVLMVLWCFLIVFA